jgi:hypothetical protein
MHGRSNFLSLLSSRVFAHTCLGDCFPSNMSTGHDPVDDLVLLSSNHSLPEQIDYDSNSTGSTMVSASVVDKISTCLLQSSPQLSRGLQTAVGITRASRVDTIESGERYAKSTREAQEAALAEMISGTGGITLHYGPSHPPSQSPPPSYDPRHRSQRLLAIRQSRSGWESRHRARLGPVDAKGCGDV